MAQMIRVKLVRSPIGHPEKHRRILRALGLTKLNKTRQLYATPTILGAIRKVVHLVELEVVEEQKG
jgi:large subunit ribosomal protein L30